MIVQDLIKDVKNVLLSWIHPKTSHGVSEFLAGGSQEKLFKKEIK